MALFLGLRLRQDRQLLRHLIGEDPDVRHEQVAGCHLCLYMRRNLSDLFQVVGNFGASACKMLLSGLHALSELLFTTDISGFGHFILNRVEDRLAPP